MDLYCGRSKKTTFVETGLTKSDISFVEDDQYAILCLKRSKTDTKPTRVQIILAAMSENTCPIAALRQLFIQDPYQTIAPFFSLQSTSFFCQVVINIFKQHIAVAGLPKSNYFGHSFQKREVIHAADHGMLDKKKLGCQIFNAFKLYFITTPKTLFNLNPSFQKRMPLAVSRAIVTNTFGIKFARYQF